MYEWGINKLVGLEIANVRVPDRYSGDGSIYLNLADGKRCIVLTPEGDCCAHCYIQHINFAEVLQGAKVTEVEDLEGNRIEPEQYGDVVDCWGHRIHTTKGICTIDMRLSHNGYYGGALTMSEQDGWYTEGKPLEDF